MEEIIARQSIARRRRPYTPIASSAKGAHAGKGQKPSSGASALGPGISGWRQEPAKRRSPSPAKVLRRDGPKAPKLGAFTFEGLEGLKAGMANKANKGRLHLKLPRLPALRFPRLPRLQGLFQGLASFYTTSFPRALPRSGRAYAPSPKPEGPSLQPPAQKPEGKWTKHLNRLSLGVSGLLGLCLLAFLATSLLRPRFPLPEGGLLPAQTGQGATVVDPLLDYLSPELMLGATDSNLDSLPIPRTMELTTYKVKSGDSLASIARRFGLTQDSIVSLNGIKSLRAVKAGTELKIPNMNGLLHVVTRGESLLSIAKTYKVELTALADSNDLGSGSIRVGQTLFIPGARLPEATLKQLYGTTVAWPVRGSISSYFGYRADPFTGVRRFHAGVDIVVNMGTPIKAAMSGVVADAGYNGNYGNYVILSHGGGLQTLYGHLSSYSVRVGQRMDQGQLLGLSGNTGYSTGPHLHFGIYRGGAAMDPLKMLK